VNAIAPKNVSGMMAIGPSKRGKPGNHQHSLNSRWQHSLFALCGLVDYVVVRMDKRLTAPQQEYIRDVIQDKGVAFVGGPIRRTASNGWREEMLRRLDHIKPDLVLTPDCDEEFGPSIKYDLERLWDSDSCGLMFDYLMDPPSNRIYPNKRQMKAYKWQPGLTYDKSVFCIPGTYHCDKKHPRIRAVTNMIHYAFIDEGLAVPVTLSVSITGRTVGECLLALGKSIAKFGR